MPSGRGIASRPLRALLLGAATAACALLGASLAFSALATGRQHGAKVAARSLALSRLRGGRAARRQAAGTAESGVKLKPGFRVQVKHDDLWWDCEIRAVSDDGSTVTARYDENGYAEHNVDVATRVRPMPLPLLVQQFQKVQVFREGVWYVCQVLEVSDDSTRCTAKYDDGGDVELDVDVSKRVRPLRISLSALKVGAKYRGTVARVFNFGGFVDIGAEREGLLHKMRITEGIVDDATKYLTAGQVVDVWVSEVESNGNFHLSMVASKLGAGPIGGRKEDVQALTAYRSDQWITGVVRGFLPMGAFVSVPTPDGSAKVSAFVRNEHIRRGYVDRAEDEVKIGQEVRVRFIGMRNGKPQVSMMGERRGSDSGDLHKFEAVPKDTWLKGKVERVAEFGIFVTAFLPDESATASGLVWLDKSDNRPEVTLGQEVQVSVLHVRNGKLRLALRGQRRAHGLKEEPRRRQGATAAPVAEKVDLERFAALPEGTWLKGKVERLATFGVFVAVSLPDGSAAARGLVHVSHMGSGWVENPEDVTEVGQEVDVWIRSVSVKDGKLNLSMRDDATGGNF